MSIRKCTEAQMIKSNHSGNSIKIAIFLEKSFPQIKQRIVIKMMFSITYFVLSPVRNTLKFHQLIEIFCKEQSIF